MAESAAVVTLVNVKCICEYQAWLATTLASHLSLANEA